MRAILDTSVFFQKDAFRQLAVLPHDIVLPAVAYAERVRQLDRDGRDVDAFDRRLAEFRITIESLRPNMAIRFTRKIHDDGSWKRLARDALIAGHVGDDDVLWTMNRDDFLAVGLSLERIHAIV